MSFRPRTFRQLAARAQEGLDFVIRVRSGSTGVAVLAPHGGGIEPGTSEIAESIAGPDHAFYAFEAVRGDGNSAFHLPSVGFDEPRALELIAAAAVVLAVHGCSGSQEMVFLGGRDEALRDRISFALSRAGFKAAPGEPRNLGGRDPRNLCNRGPGGSGVQLELTRALRQRCFRDLSRAGRKSGSSTLDRLSRAVRAVLSDPA